MLEAMRAHLGEDGACHDITRRQLQARVMIGHEAMPIRAQQQSPFAPYRLGYQKGRAIGVIQAGGMKLLELQVHQAGAGAGRHRHAITDAGARAGGVGEQAAGTAGGQYQVIGCQPLALARAIHHPQTTGATRVDRDVDGQQVFENLDVRMGFDMGAERIEQRSPGGVGGVDDAAATMPAFTGEVEGVAGVGVGRGEGHAECDQPFDGLPRVADGEAHRALVAQAIAGNQGVGDMGFHIVLGRQHCRDTALCPAAGALCLTRRTQQRDAAGTRAGGQAIGEAECQGQTCRAATDDQHVMLACGSHSGY